MNISFNIQKLRKVMRDFYNCTQIPVTLFDSEFNCVLGVGAPQAYCTAIRSNPELLAKCNCSNVENSEEARNMGCTHVYTCHAGIAESVTPIFQDNLLLAYLMIGKFRDEEGVFSSHETAQSAIRRYGLDEEKMLKAYEDIPVYSKQYIDSANSILEICIRYIWSESIIRLKHSALSSQIEAYIVDNLNAPLSVNDLCKRYFTSRQTLYSIFKNEFNDTVKNFILNKRLQEAQRLLTKTQRSIYEIADAVGFSDYNYFIRIFKKKVGITPLQFRKEQK